MCFIYVFSTISSGGKEGGGGDIVYQVRAIVMFRFHRLQEKRRAKTCSFFLVPSAVGVKIGDWPRSTRNVRYLTLLAFFALGCCPIFSPRWFIIARKVANGGKNCPDLTIRRSAVNCALTVSFTPLVVRPELTAHFWFATSVFFSFCLCFLFFLFFFFLFCFCFWFWF